MNKTCQSAWYNLHHLTKLKKYLSNDQLRTVIHAFVTTKLDQNNSLLFGLPKTVISKLQSVQNAAARLIAGQRKYDRKAAPLRDLHWLPVEKRIVFKILLLCYKSLNNNGPDYLKELLLPYKPSRSLRSTSALLLVEPRTSLITYGDRAFSVAAPRLWNHLPQHIRMCTSVSTFKMSLKTYLFKEAFEC